MTGTSNRTGDLHLGEALEEMLARLQPRRRAGRFVITAATTEALDQVSPQATVLEDEGLTIVVSKEQADAVGLSYQYIAAWITLGLESDLAAVGLTAVVASELAGAGLSCNVIAGLHHDHLLVPEQDVDAALRILENLATPSA